MGTHERVSQESSSIIEYRNIVSPQKTPSPMDIIAQNSGPADGSRPNPRHGIKWYQYTSPLIQPADQPAGHMLPSRRTPPPPPPKGMAPVFIRPTCVERALVTSPRATHLHISPLSTILPTLATSVLTPLRLVSSNSLTMPWTMILRTLASALVKSSATAALQSRGLPSKPSRRV